MTDTNTGGKQIRDGGQLRLTDDGLEMPEMLRGYKGQFEIKTPNITGQINTTEEGLPDEDFYDGPIANYPEEGDYNDRLDEGEMIVQARGYPNTKFEIVDERSEEVDSNE